MSQSRQLIKTKYFTARISGPNQAKQKRQTISLEALETLRDLEITYGKYLRNEKRCYNCGNIINSYSEKMTDVTIAVTLLADAHMNEFDTAIVVSGDSDLSPPKRSSFDLRQVANDSFRMSDSAIRQSQLPSTVTKSDGTLPQCPSRRT